MLSASAVINIFRIMYTFLDIAELDTKWPI